MVAKLLDGKLVSSIVKEELKDRVENLKRKGIVPALGTVLVGSDIGSKKYVAGKQADCKEVGIGTINVELPEEATEQEVLDAVKKLNEDPNCTGYIVQLPLPKHISQENVINAIDPKKDADGLHPMNLGNLSAKVSGKINSPLPCTPLGIIRLLKHYNLNLDGKHVVIIGRGVTAGRPLAGLLTRKDINATVTIAHSGTPNISELTRNADAVVVAIGKAHFLKACDIKKSAIIIDVGVSRIFDPEQERYRVLGDCALDIRDVASYVSPNPGGIGPMTRAMLLENIVNIAEKSV